MISTQTKYNSLEMYIQEDRPTLAMFYSDTNTRSAEEMPVFDRAIRQLDGNAHLVKVDADAQPDEAARYHVHNFPTFILFRDGQEAWRAEGRLPMDEIRDMVARFV